MNIATSPTSRLFILILLLAITEKIEGQDETTPEEDSNEFITETEFPTTTSTVITEICGRNPTNFIEVSDRTSTSFVALIRYNCSFINATHLNIAFNSSHSANCSLSKDETRDNITINARCHHIQKNAGRNWRFEIFSVEVNDGIINETFTITLQPLQLNDSRINYAAPTKTSTSISVSIGNCGEISDFSYLGYRCGNSSNINETVPSPPNDCLLRCDRLTPGSNYSISFIRRTITYIDNRSQSSSEEIRNITTQTDLDRVTNLRFNETSLSQTSGNIIFTTLIGNYDRIELNCFPIDQRCLSERRNVTEMCTACSVFPLSSLVGGLRYQCLASTIRAGFPTRDSDLFTFNIRIQSVLVEDEIRLNRTVMSFNASNNGTDFDHLQLNCLAKEDQKSVCLNISIRNPNCSTTFQFVGTPGCDYQCSIETIKPSYSLVSSSRFNITVDPLEPTLTRVSQGSRQIFLQWTFESVTNIQSFDLYQNNRPIFSSNATEYLPNQTQFSQDITDDLLPFHTYNYSVRVQSNREIFSNVISVLTDEEAPRPPDPTTVDPRISIPVSHPSSSHTTRYIEIDSQLFSGDYGPLTSYRIYIRQDQTNNVPNPSPNGTYSDASRNVSIDYLAYNIVLPLKTLKSGPTNLSLVLGNDTSCSNGSYSSPTCNGPLRPEINYRMLIGGCTQKGCTHVLSKGFQTYPYPPPSPSNLGWVAIFPILAVLALVAVGIWKRKPLKEKFDETKKKFKKSDSNTRRQSIVHLESIYSVPPLKPKPLSKFANVAKDEEAIFAEFKELERQAHQYRRSEMEEEYAIYDRYANIAARGPWENTAVRLLGDDRVHDYINANEIQGFNREKEYIACQGPLEGTVEDFWHMIVQYRTTRIVMLTRTEERNPHNPSQSIRKCFAYFPAEQGQTLTFGPMVVRLTEVQRPSTGDLEIRKIVIKSPRSEHRVTHYYFTGWPDFSVVDHSKLLDLIETVNRDPSNSPVPIVVHCSAGVGRTGTYIAVDILMKIIDRAGNNLLTTNIDVMGVVQKMRKDRGKMVQTKDQYMLIHRAVEEYLRRTNRLDGANDYENDSSVDESSRSSRSNTGPSRRQKRPNEESNHESIPRKSSTASSRQSHTRAAPYRVAADGTPQAKK